LCGFGLIVCGGLHQKFELVIVIGGRCGLAFSFGWHEML
jgi:hypothetical protein